MKKIITVLIILSFILQVNANNKKTFSSLRVTYENSFNNEVREGFSTVLDISGTKTRITTRDVKAEKDDPIQAIYMDYNDQTEIKIAQLKGRETIYTQRHFNLNDGLIFLDDVEVIAGYTCKKAKTIINSNTIEIWYTTDLGVNGTMQPQTAIPEGLVLKIVRNGQTAQTASKIELLKTEIVINTTLDGVALDARHYNYRVQQSKVLSVNVFDHESIYFRDITAPQSLSETEVMHFANGSVLLKKVTLPIESKDYAIFAELTHYSEGDAYDRTGSLFLIPVDKKQSFLDGLLKGKDALPQYIDRLGNKYEGMTAQSDYQPILELMRFYTTFGVRGYNKIEVADYIWPDSVLYKQEITDYSHYLKGEVWLGAWIGNYSQNGHNVTLDIKYYPQDIEDIRPEKVVYPLFATVNVLEMAGQTYPDRMFKNDSLTIEVETHTDLTDAYIRYISTGHGGWGGGDEFNPKLNELFLDDKLIMAYTPWREDCGSYRNLNPASGNFSNGLSSSDLSRSGWCPGMISYPVFVHIGSLKAGKHQVKVAIPVGEPAGSSRSYWCISGALVGTYK